MLTDLQKTCCVQHLRTFYPLIRAENIPFPVLTTLDETILVGVEPYTPNPVLYHGTAIASEESVLGNAHKAYLQTLVGVTDTTQFVVSAGEVTLNPREHQKRAEVYKDAVKKLAQALRYSVDSQGGYGYPLSGDVGYAAGDVGGLPYPYETFNPQ